MVEEESKQKIRNVVYGFMDPFDLEKLCKTCQEKGIKATEDEVISSFDEIKAREPSHYIKEIKTDKGEILFQTLFGIKVRG